MQRQLLPITEMFERCVQFHGHACGGLALGVRMAYEALAALEVDPSSLWDEALVCITETDACCIDAVQCITGCTLGKGNLLIKPRGKMAMTFMHRPSKKSVRVLWTAPRKETYPKWEDKGRQIQDYLTGANEGDWGTLLTVQTVAFNPPPKALMAPSYVCSHCKERVAEFAMKLLNGQPYCLDCYPDHSRILK